MVSPVDGAKGAAKRRRDRRLRASARHVRTAVQMAVAEVSHHSCGKFSAAVSAYGVPRGRPSAMDKPEFCA